MAQKIAKIKGAWSPNLLVPQPHEFCIKGFEIKNLDEDLIAFFSADKHRLFTRRTYCECTRLGVNEGLFYGTVGSWDNTTVQVKQDEKKKVLSLICRCKEPKKYLCAHQAAMLHILLTNQETRVGFDAEMRRQMFVDMARKFGLEEEKNLDEFFGFQFDRGRREVYLKRQDLVSVDSEFELKLKKSLLPPSRKTMQSQVSDTMQEGLIFSQSKYSDQFFIYYFQAPVSQKGGIKNPVTEQNALLAMSRYDQVDILRFFSAISLLKDRYESGISVEDRMGALRQIVKNPLGLPLFYHDASISENISIMSIKEIEIQHSMLQMHFKVADAKPFYQITASVILPNGKKISLQELKCKFDSFFLINGIFYLLNNPFYSRLYHFFKSHRFIVSIHHSQFDVFKKDYLDQLQAMVQMEYTFAKPATVEQISQKGLSGELEKCIYIDEADDFILLTPVVRYGEVELPLMSSRTIYDFDQDKKLFSYDRNVAEENRYLGLLLRQHADFNEQLGQFDHFYLPKYKFFDEGWLVEAYDVWKKTNITVFGFKKLRNNTLNPNKVQVTIHVSSEMNWFETQIKVKFGDQVASLSKIQKALKNKMRFVELDDGTRGLLPEEWIEKFSRFFRTGEISGNKIKISKTQFSLINELFEVQDLDNSVKQEVADLKHQFETFEWSEEYPSPPELKVQLRDYQKKGLAWLHFLNKFQFGGCLADDMGLGKTVQILAFLLDIKRENPEAVHLIVLPTSLLFNWQNEVKKFAPTLKVYEHYGSNRKKSKPNFAAFDLVLTSYGTLLSDIKLFQTYPFDFVVLDESQAIKNPQSMRYKAVCLLNSRNRIVLTGTPIENNTFDLYAQLSFINPGIFGNRTKFRDEYALPIDKFKETKRAKELRSKIHPFLLRRTKQQVARELPEKTEMILYCEMGVEQRTVYNQFREAIREEMMSVNSEEVFGSKSMLMLKGLTKLRQICNSPATLNEEQDYGASSAKLEVLMEELRARHQSNKILIFSQFVSMLDLIQKELDQEGIQYEKLIGETKNRKEVVANFQENENVRVFLISLKAGGVGLNLTEADYVYLVDPWWNPAVENQAIDRCHRMGQDKKVVAVRLICPDTIEEKIQLLQGTKKDLSHDLIKTDEEIAKKLTREDLLALLD